ncbi:hypothetical protein LTR43_008354 [Exophiala xenobiotica]|nr:hypothetical protein LTR93_008968 [Exophiala xenobiotica]KAK5497428.1 hypothetical protein LTR55_001920 [Exophiala xenobiotica]
MSRVAIPLNHPLRTGAFAREQRRQQRAEPQTVRGWKLHWDAYTDKLSDDRLDINKKDAAAELKAIIATASTKPKSKRQLPTPPRTPPKVTEPRQTPPDWTPPPGLPVIESSVREEVGYKREIPTGSRPEPNSVFPAKKPTKRQTSYFQGALFQALGPPAARPLNLEELEGQLRGLPYPLNNFVFVKENVKPLFDKVLDDFNSNPAPIVDLHDKCRELARAIIDEVRIVDEDYAVVQRVVASVKLKMHGAESCTRAFLIARTTREELQTAYDIAEMGIAIGCTEGFGLVAGRPCTHPRYRRALAMARADKREEEIYRAEPISASLPEME